MMTVPCRYRLLFSDRQLGLTEHLDALVTASAFLNNTSSNSNSSTAPTRYSAVKAKLTCIKALVSDLQQRLKRSCSGCAVAHIAADISKHTRNTSRLPDTITALYIDTATAALLLEHKLLSALPALQCDVSDYVAESLQEQSETVAAVQRGVTELTPAVLHQLNTVKSGIVSIMPSASVSISSILPAELSALIGTASLDLVQ
eukprot:21103-Heterococcus_DN1.PRE.2